MRVWLRNNTELGVLRLMQLSIILFLSGFHAWANTFVIVGFALVLFTRNLDELKANFSSLIFWLFISYFLLTLTAVLWSEDLSQGFKYVELRLLFILFPFIFWHVELGQKKVNTLLLTFVYGLFLSLLAGFTNSLFNYLQTSDSGYFYNDNLVEIIDKQATYFSVYINVALAIILFVYKKVGRLQNVLLSFITLLLLVSQLLLAVRISILTLFFLLIILIIYMIAKNGSRVTIGLGMGLIITTIVMIFTFPQTFNRFKSMMSNFEYKFDNPNPVNHFNGEITAENWNGLNLRLALWHCGWDIIKEQPIFGVGTGDYKHEMRTQFDIKNFIYAKERDFGVHNQFIYTLITFGAFGVVIFLCSLIIPLLSAIKEYNNLYLLFLTIIVFGFLTENLLNKYIGVYSFNLLNSLIFFQVRKAS